MYDYVETNSRDIFKLFSSRGQVMFLSIDALDFKDKKGTPDPKMKIRAMKFDANKGRGNRVDQEISVYLPIGEFLTLSHNVLHGAFYKNRLLLEREGRLRNAVFFEHYGGRKGPPIVSTKLSLIPGMGNDASFAFLLNSGPGKFNQIGGITPIPEATAQAMGNFEKSKSIFVNMPNEKLKEFCLIGSAYITQFIGLDLQNRLTTIQSVRERSGGQSYSPGPDRRNGDTCNDRPLQKN